MPNTRQANNVVNLHIAPKTLKGSRRATTWTITYIPREKLWEWCVTTQLAPQTYKGKAPTQREAQMEVDKYLR